MQLQETMAKWLRCLKRMTITVGSVLATAWSGFCTVFWNLLVSWAQSMTPIESTSDVSAKTEESSVLADRLPSDSSGLCDSGDAVLFDNFIEEEEGFGDVVRCVQQAEAGPETHQRQEVVAVSALRQSVQIDQPRELKEIHMPMKTEPMPTVLKKKQVELSDNQLDYLSKEHFSKESWVAIAKLQSFDPDTVEWLPNSNRAFLAVPKKWPPDPPPTGNTLTTKNIFAGAPEPISVAEMREHLRKQDLTKTISDETHTEEV